MTDDGGETVRQRWRRVAAVAWLGAFAEEVAANRELLTQLDSAIGDADHGANMDRGMTAVVAALDDAAARRRPAAPLLKTASG